jgi:hypothetical protein
MKKIEAMETWDKASTFVQCSEQREPRRRVLCTHQRQWASWGTGSRQRAVHSPALYSGITIGSIKAGVECEKEMGENKSPTP